MTRFMHGLRRALLLSGVAVSAAASCTYSVAPLRNDALDGGDGDGGIDAGKDVVSPCGDVLANARQCGECGHDCLGQACANGTCLPKVLAGDQNEPRALAVDDRAVYWGSGSGAGIAACLDKSCTGGPKSIADEPAAVIALASTKSYLLWATRGSVGRYPKDVLVDDGGAAAVDNGVVGNVVAFAANDAFFYFTYVNDTRGGVARCPIDGCDGANGAQQLAYDFDRPAGLGVGDAGFAFAAGVDTRSIVYCAPECADPPANMANVVAERQSEPDSIALDETHAYWTNALAGPGDGVVRASLAAPHAPSTLASVATPGPIAIDGAFVYFVSRRDGSIHKVRKSGGGDIVLVAGQATPPSAIAVDDKRLYFTVSGAKGSVLWVAK